MNFKSILAAALITIAGTAHAGGTLARMPNTVGGYIELTNVPCGGDQVGWLAHSYATTQNTPDIMGCWNSYNEDYTTISVIWTNADRTKNMRTYNTSAFTQTRYGSLSSSWSHVNQ